MFSHTKHRSLIVLWQWLLLA